LIEVIHHEDRIEAGAFRCGRKHGDVLEQAIVGHVGKGEVGNLKSE
jgi:hypothetical protein